MRNSSVFSLAGLLVLSVALGDVMGCFGGEARGGGGDGGIGGSGGGGGLVEGGGGGGGGTGGGGGGGGIIGSQGDGSPENFSPTTTQSDE